MEDYNSDVIFIRAEPREVRYKYLKTLSHVPMAKVAPRVTKLGTLIYEDHVDENYLRPIVILPGKHFDAVTHQNALRGWGTDGIKDRFYLLTVLVFERDRVSEWFKAGISDTKGRIWFVDPC